MTAPRPTQQVDAVLLNPASPTRLCDESTFAAILENMVADDAPRLFAIVQEYGERVDARIAGWGMAFDDHAEVVSVERGLRMHLRTPENALRLFSSGLDVRARLVWCKPNAATPSQDNEAD